MWWCIVLVTLVTLFATFFIILSGLGSYYKFTNVQCQSKKLLIGKTALITGSSTGIGFEVALDLASRGARVIVTCPFKDEGTEAAHKIVENTDNKSVVFKFLDLSSLSSVRKFAQDIIMNEPRLDLLINNAGVLQPDMTTMDGLNFVMQVNYFGHFLLTILLLPLLRKTGTTSEPSRVVNTASMAHARGEIDIQRLNSTSYNKHTHPFYSNSKLCVTMFTRQLASRIKDFNIVVNTTDPRIARSRIFKGLIVLNSLNFILGKFYPSPRDGAQTTLHLALDNETGLVNGEYYKNCNKSRAARKVYNDKMSNELWNKSVKLVKLSVDEIMLALE